MTDYNKLLYEAVLHCDIPKAKEAVEHDAKIDAHFDASFGWGGKIKQTDGAYKYRVPEKLTVDALLVLILVSEESLAKKMRFLAWLKEQHGFDINRRYYFTSWEQSSTLLKREVTGFFPQANIIFLLLMAGVSWERPAAFHSSSTVNPEFVYALFNDFSQDMWKEAFDFYCSVEDESEASKQPGFGRDVNIQCVFWLTCFLGGLKPYHVKGIHTPFSEVKNYQLSNYPNPVELCMHDQHDEVVLYLQYLRLKYRLFDALFNLSFTQFEKILDRVVEQPLSISLDGEEIGKLISKFSFNCCHKRINVCEADLWSLMLMLYRFPDAGSIKQNVLNALKKIMPMLAPILQKEDWQAVCRNWIQLILSKNEVVPSEHFLPIFKALINDSIFLERFFCSGSLEFVRWFTEQEDIDMSLLTPIAWAKGPLAQCSNQFQYFARYPLANELKSALGDTLFEALLASDMLRLNPEGKEGYCGYGDAYPDKRLFIAAATCDVEAAKASKHSRSWVDYSFRRLIEGVWQPLLSVSEHCLISPASVRDKLAFLKAAVTNFSHPVGVSNEIKLNRIILSSQSKTIFSVLAENEENYPLVLLSLLSEASREIPLASLKNQNPPGKIAKIIEVYERFIKPGWPEFKRLSSLARSFQSKEMQEASEALKVGYLTALLWSMVLFDDWFACVNNERFLTEYPSPKLRLKVQQVSFQGLDVLDIAVDLGHSNFFIMASLYFIELDFERLLTLVDRYSPQKLVMLDASWSHLRKYIFEDIEKTLKEAIHKNNIEVLLFFLFCCDAPDWHGQVVRHLIENIDLIKNDQNHLFYFLRLVARCKDETILDTLEPLLKGLLNDMDPLFEQTCLLQNDIKLLRFLIRRGANPQSLPEATLAKLFLDKEKVDICIFLLDDGHVNAHWKDADGRYSTIAVEGSKTLPDDAKKRLLYALILHEADFSRAEDPQLQVRISNRSVNIAFALNERSKIHARALEALNEKLAKQGELLQAETQEKQRLLELMQQDRGLITALTVQCAQLQSKVTAQDTEYQQLHAYVQQTIATFRDAMLVLAQEFQELRQHLESSQAALEGEVTEEVTEPVTRVTIAELPDENSELSSLKKKVDALEARDTERDAEMHEMQEEMNRVKAQLAQLMRLLPANDVTEKLSKRSASASPRLFGS